MKRAVVLAGLLLFVSFVFPNGPSQFVIPSAGPVIPNVPADQTIVQLLSSAPAADKSHIAGIYMAMRDVVKRDAGKLINTTEKWAMYQENTLKLAIGGTALKGKYPGLDVAIESVFERALGKDKEVVPTNEDVRNKIIGACDTIAASTK